MPEVGKMQLKDHDKVSNLKVTIGKIYFKVKKIMTKGFYRTSNMTSKEIGMSYSPSLVIHTS